MGDVTNVKLGVCSINFGGVDLGHTKGGCEVTYTPEWYAMTVDKYGNTQYDKALIGEKLVAKVPLAESTLANIKAAMPASTLDGSTKVTVGRQAGHRLASEAEVLVLHPIVNAASDLSEDVKFHLAASGGEVTLPFKVDGEKIIEVTFEAFIDESQEDGALLAFFGDYIA
jgi:hypothetical protein